MEAAVPWEVCPSPAQSRKLSSPVGMGEVVKEACQEGSALYFQCFQEKTAMLATVSDKESDTSAARIGGTRGKG